MVRIRLWLVSLALAPLSAVLGGAGQNQPVATAAVPSTPDGARAMLDRYCVTCHNARLKTGGLVLEGLSVRDAARARRGVGEGGPQGARGRDAAAGRARARPRDALGALAAAALETALDRAAAARPNPGRPMLHRLNRAEYANAIRDLLALDVDAATLLPPDDSAYGFDNIADVLGVSPSLQERYLAAAARISALAVGDPAHPARQRHLPRAAGPVAEPARRGAAARHRRRPARAPLLSARRRVRRSRPSCIAPT